MSKIEFNNGFITALTLFYGHRMDRELISSDEKNDLRIYGASDHLIDIEYPKNLDPKLKKRIIKFVGNVLDIRLKKVSFRKAEKLFNECLEILKEIDKKYFGLKVKVKYV
jgi:hypothetical protein